MTIEVRANLALSFRNKSEAPLVTEQSACSTDSVGAGVPQGSQSAPLMAQFDDPLLAPGQMITFLVRRLLHLRLDILVSRDSRMRLVQGLRRDFASVIDPHKSGCVGFLFGIELRAVDVIGGITARGASGGRQNGAQRVVGARQQSIQRRQVA